MREASPSPPKVAPKKVAIHSRPTKKKVMKMLESEDSSSTDEEEASSTPRAELAYNVLSSEQNKIRR